MFTKLDSQSLCIYLELLSMKGIRKSITLHYQEWNKDYPKFSSPSPSPYFISITTRYQHDSPEAIGIFGHLRQFRTFAKTRSTPGLPKFCLLLICFKSFSYMYFAGI